MNLLQLTLAFLFRAKARTMLAIAAMVVAFALFGTLDPIRLAFASQTKGQVARLVVTSLTSMNEGLPRSTSSIFEKLGIADNRISWANWMGGYYQDPAKPIANIAISTTYLHLYPEFHVSNAALKRFRATRDGVIVGQHLLAQQNWHIGQRIQLLGVPYQARDAINSAWSYQIVGTFQAASDKMKALENQFFSRWDYFNQMALYAHDQVGWFIVDAGSDNENALAAVIDRATTNSPDPTKTQTEQAFQRTMVNQLVSIGWMTHGLILLAITFVLVLTGKVMAHSIRESRRELGMMKAMGFPPRFLLGIMLLQSVLMVVCSAIAGMLVATLGVKIAQVSSGMGMLLQPVTTRAWTDAVTLALLTGIAVAFVPSTRASLESPSNLLCG